MTDPRALPKEINQNTTPFPTLDEDVISLEKEKIARDTPRLKKRNDNTHRRAVSGSILSRLTFLRPNSDQYKTDGIDKENQVLGSGRSTMIEAQTQSKRKRKGSLRKTVLGKGRDRKVSELKKSPLSSINPTTAQTPAEGTPTPRPSADFSSPVSPESPPSWVPFRTLSRVSIPSIRSSVASVEPASSAASIISPTLPMDASTDDEDLIIARATPLRKWPSASTDSYFPLQDPVRRMFSTTSRTRSPLATAPQSNAGTPPIDEGWDYGETAFWGYVILVITWITFVIGMGSCFGVWSWAWDVGETPYAPPEFENDESLPIVGYYPALMVLTGVMAWVWVIVAWVGMKYFRHADFRGDD